MSVEEGFGFDVSSARQPIQPMHLARPECRRQPEQEVLQRPRDRALHDGEQSSDAADDDSQANEPCFAGTDAPTQGSKRGQDVIDARQVRPNRWRENDAERSVEEYCEHGTYSGRRSSKW